MSGFSSLPDSAPNLAHAQDDIERVLQTGGGSWFSVLRIDTINGMRMGENYRFFIKVVVRGQSPVSGWAFQCPERMSCDTDFSGPPAIQLYKTYTKEGWVDFMVRDGKWSPSDLVLKEPKSIKAIASAQGTTSGQSFVLRIVSKPGQPSGVWRVPPENPAVRNYYIIVEVVDSQGRPAAVDVTSEEDNKTARVSTFGIRVDQKTFEQIRADKQDDGIIQNSRFGEQQAGDLEWRYSFPTSGGAILQW